LQSADNLSNVGRRFGATISQVANLFGTTANPRPASPARADSIEALRERRLVRSAMTLMVSTMPEISEVRLFKSRMALLVWPIALATRPIPSMDF